MSIICDNCGHDNQDDALFCDECGEELATTTMSPEEEEFIPLAETYSEATADEAVYSETTANEQSLTEVSTDATPPEPEPYVEPVSVPTEVSTTLQSEVEPVSESVSVATKEPEELPSALPVGAATRLELDEPPLQKIVAPPTTLELPELPTAILIDRESGTKFVLPSEEKTVYIGRLNEEFPVQIDLSGIPHADLISRVHAAIHLENEVYYLEDAGSANGTWLNETQIQPGIRFRQQLNPGDTIAFGHNQTIKLTFDLED